MPARPCLQWFIFIIIGWPKKNIAEVQSWLDNTQCESTNFEWKERESPPVGVREEAKMLRALTGFLTWGKTFKMFLSIGNPGLIVDYHEYLDFTISPLGTRWGQIFQVLGFEDSPKAGEPTLPPSGLLPTSLICLFEKPKIIFDVFTSALAFATSSAALLKSR